MLIEVTTTYLEMLSPEAFKPKEGFIQKVNIIEIENEQFVNMMLFCGVGLPWKWYSRLQWGQQQWDNYFTNEKSTLFLGMQGKSIIGYIELLHHQDSSIEIKFFGLLPEWVGSGLGGMLLSHAVRQAWSFQPDRLWVHTCTLDGPGAMQNYLSRGFSIYNEETIQEDVPDHEKVSSLLQQYFVDYIRKYANR